MRTQILTFQQTSLHQHRRKRPSRRRFAAALIPRLFGTKVPGHTTKAPQVGFELATNCIQLFAIANLDKTSWRWAFQIVAVSLAGAASAASGGPQSQAVNGQQRASPSCYRAKTVTPGRQLQVRLAASDCQSRIMWQACARGGRLRCDRAPGPCRSRVLNLFPRLRIQ